ncbi:hypothetical protein [Flavobacterium gelidilacus]|uniref:hypothetical protein n=1 Tax=Flavobacterium gelidilacus TaxID=206041 RepID=UPI0004249237|nr:hypothetical protein [Flavobacterium gelidilacus]
MTIHFWFLISLVITSLAIWSAFVLIRDGEWKIAIFMLPFVVLFPIIFIHSLTSRIILTTDSIIRKNLFGKKELKYDTIRTFKKYDTIGNGKGYVAFLETDEKELDSKNFFSLKTIYVSTSENSHPNKIAKNKGLTFHETSDIYLILKGKINIIDNG